MKKNIIYYFTALLLTFISFSSFARDYIAEYDIQSALNIGKEKGILVDDIALYFGSQPAPVTKMMGEFRTNKKTNAFNKSDQEACYWTFLSAIKTLQERAKREGGTKVVQIKSNYKNKEFVSETQFQCGAGRFVAGVALKGRVAK